MSSLRLDVTLPCHARYLPMLRQLTGRAVEYLGYRETSREEVLQAVDLATASVFDPDGPYDDVEVRLVTTEADMVVRVRYLGAASGASGPTPIESLLSQSDGAESPLARLQRAMSDVVFGRESGDDAADYCELTRPLPGADV